VAPRTAQRVVNRGVRHFVASQNASRRATVRRMSTSRACSIACAALALLAVSSLAVPALAQAPDPEPSCETPCKRGERCVEGQCVGNPDARPPAAPAEAPPRATPDSDEDVVPAPKAAPAARTSPPEEAKPQPRPAERESWRRGLLVLPTFGVHFVEGVASADYGAGLRLGLLIGTHVSPTVSLNVEIARNFLSPHPPPGSTDNLSGGDVTIAFSPLFHAAAGPVDIVAGPKLGFWSLTVNDSSGQLGTDQAFENGWTFGLNLGFFVGTGDAVAIGAMFAYQIDLLTQSCARGLDVNNQGCDITGFPPQFLSLSAGALF
jgi:hypothetical protein